jgi:hypothetical protein
MSKDFFPLRPEVTPTIYAYELIGVEKHRGWIKVGDTIRDVRTRIDEQLKTSRLEYKILLEESAMKKDGSSFRDYLVHEELRKRGFSNPEGEWFICTVDDVKSAILSIKEGATGDSQRTLSFSMRPEQSQAVEKAITYYSSFRKENPDKTPHFLWNAKMRFGKTFATYQLALKMGWKKVLVLTFKPAVQSAWEEDLKTHKDFQGWQFLSRNGLHIEDIDESKPIVLFGSFQDFLGKNKSTGGIKIKNEWVHGTNWDAVVFDEYHYGAWRENAKELFEAEDKKEIEFGEGEGIEYFDEEIMPITTNHYLYLSGTPFRAITSGEFIEEQIYNWTYSDEQREKENWRGSDNPYLSLPRMVMMTYQLPESIIDIAMQGEFDEFDLNIFFSANGDGDNAKFKYENEVQKWLDLIRGAYLETSVDELKLGAKKPPMPFSHAPLLKTLTHTFWFLPTVASCNAMKNLISQPQNIFYQDYKVIVAAGSSAGIGVAALPPVQDAMEDPLKTKTITLSCGKLTTGVSVKPWSGIFMLRNSSSPETPCVNIDFAWS